MAEPRVNRDPSGLKVALHRRHGVARAVAGGVVAIGFLVLLLAAFLSVLSIVRQGLDPSPPPMCTWDAVHTHPRCRNDDPMRTLNLERILLGRRAYHLAELDPSLDVPGVGQLVGTPPRSHAEAYWLDQPEDARAHLQKLVRTRKTYERTEIPFEPSRIHEPGYLGRLVVSPRRTPEVGIPEIVGPMHPLALEADGRALEEIERARPLVDGLARAAWIDDFEGTTQHFPPQEPIHWAWPASFLLGGLGLLTMGLLAFAWTLRPAPFTIAVDPVGIWLGRRRMRWEEVAATDLSWRRPSVLHVDGTRLHAPPVHVPPELGLDLQEAATAWMALRDEPEEAKEEVRHALAAARARADASPGRDLG